MLAIRHFFCPLLRSKKSYSSWQTRGKRWLTSGKTDGNGCDWVTLVKSNLIEYSLAVVIWWFDCILFGFSSGGAPVLTGCRCGWGMAAGPGAISVQSRDGSECGWGGEAHQEARGVREVSRHLGGAFCCSGEAYHCERESGNFVTEQEIDGNHIIFSSILSVRVVLDGITGSEKTARGRGKEKTGTTCRSSPWWHSITTTEVILMTWFSLIYRVCVPNKFHKGVGI